MGVPFGQEVGVRVERTEEPVTFGDICGNGKNRPVDLGDESNFTPLPQFNDFSKRWGMAEATCCVLHIAEEEGIEDLSGMKHR